jgi:hypothetical protein
VTVRVEIDEAVTVAAAGHDEVLGDVAFKLVELEVVLVGDFVVVLNPT